MGRTVRSQLLPLFFLVVLICCIKLACGSLAPEPRDAEIRCIEEERQALLRFKQRLTDDYGLLYSWGSAEQDCCKWTGVSCSNRTGHVIMLDLHARVNSSGQTFYGFSGEIDSSLVKLRHLKYLDLSGNSFHQIPEFIGSLRNLQFLDVSYTSTVVENLEWVSQLTSLKHLDLSTVELSKATNWLDVISKLPSLVELKLSLCLLPNITTASFLPETNFSKSLAVLDISYNYLSASSIYPWLFNFSSSLIDINLSSNELLGTVPETFGTFASLQHLDISFNKLEGGIPRSFGNLSNLASLDLTLNNLNEQLLLVLNNLSGPAEKSLEILKLAINQLSGSLPDFTTFSSLRELHLYHNHLNGSFPKHFGQPSNLLILDLSYNQIIGSLPDLSVFSSMRVLNLMNNYINSTLPESIGQLSKLELLGAASNFLHGTVSEAHFSNLSNLEILDLSLNSLALEFGSDWAPTFQLDIIWLSSCKLGPSFPKWLQNQKNFSVLDISGAKISDTIPNWFWDLTPRLGYLNLSHNEIHGMIPNLLLSFPNCDFIDLSSNNLSGAISPVPSNITVLYLSKNKFSGSVSFLCNISGILLAHLDLSDNLLSGKLPDCWMLVNDLRVLNLGNNKFVGRIPTSIGSLHNIYMLSMRSNSFDGELPSSLKNCTRLQLLDLGDNKLTGKIPEWLGNSLSSLVVLSLRSNRFYGAIPISFCHVDRIRILDLSLNNISGIIPKCLNNFTGMIEREYLTPTLYYSSFDELYSFPKLERIPGSHELMYVFNALLEWKGRQSEYRNTLGLVNSLDLSSNQLTGEIPGEIMSLIGLIALNLSRNNLIGPMPLNIGQLRWLDFLDLSRNQLVGEIPMSLAQLSNLGVLDLSNNNLSGRIPSGTQLQSFHASSYVGNPALCGLPLPNACPGDEAPQPQDPRITDGSDDIEEGESEDKLLTTEFYNSLGLGFAFGFGGVCGTLLLQKSWRCAYFKFLNTIKDWFYMTTFINLARLQRRYQRSM